MRDRRGQGAAGLAIHARHGNQVLHRRVGADLAQTHPLLNRLRQLLHQGQPARDPAQAAIETLRQSREVQTKRPPQLAQQPALLQRRLRFRLAQRAAEQEGPAFAQSPDRGQDRVAAQAAQGTQALVAVDHHEATGFVRRDHDDRNLLAVLGKRGEQAPLALGPPDAQPLVAHIKLVQLELHGTKPGEDQSSREDRCVTACPRSDVIAP
jgi:hypothetical protein